MENLVFVQDGRFTPLGLEVKAYLESLFVEADKAPDLTRLNALSGHVASYYVMAYKGAGKGFGCTPEQWFEDFASAARAAHRDMVHMQEVAAQEAERVRVINETAQNTSDIAAKLEQVMAELAEAKQRLAALEVPAAQPVVEAAPADESPAKPKRGKKVQPVVEAEAETPAADAEAKDDEDDEDKPADAQAEPAAEPEADKPAEDEQDEQEQDGDEAEAAKSA